MINSLNKNKSCGLNSIPTKILKLLKIDISEKLSDLFNLSFTLGSFPTSLKGSEVIPIYKKDSRLLCQNYRPISLLTKLDKILKRLMYNRLIGFLSKNNLLFSH